MARLFQAGFEGNDLTSWWLGSGSGNSWVIAINSTTPLYGTYDLKISRAAGLGNPNPSASANVWVYFVNSQSMWRTVDTTTEDTAKAPIRIRFYLQVTTWPATGSTLAQICRIKNTLGNLNSTGVQISGPSGTLKIRTTGATAAGQQVAISTGTSYRIELAIFDHGVITDVYNASTGAWIGNSVLNQTGYIYGEFGDRQWDQLHFGLVTISGGVTDAAYEWHLDDIAVNDSTNPSNRHSWHNAQQPIGDGHAISFVQPNAAGTYAEWTKAGAALYTNIDEWPPTAVDFNENPTVAPALQRDAYNFADYPGANTVRSVAMMFGTNFILASANSYGFGMYSGGTLYGGETTQMTSYTGTIIDQTPGSDTPWTNTAYNSAELAYFRKASGSTTEDCQLYAVGMEYEEGTAYPTGYPGDLTQVPQAVNRASTY